MSSRNKRSSRRRSSDVVVDRVVFLDFDGVLLSLKDLRLHGNGYLNPISVGLVMQLCDETNSKVVVSSTWRKHQDTPGIMKKVGLWDYTHKDWKTGEWDGRTKNWCRGHEVDAWLKDHPEVKRYVLLDDDSDFFDHQLPFHVKPKTENGLYPHHIGYAYHILMS